jgi:FkbM family methyltransferase
LIRHQWLRARNVLAPRWLGYRLGLRPRPDNAKIGTKYGGWVVPTSLIRPDWVVWCVGVGEDITFDLGLVERFGVDVYGIDPTPRAKTHAESAAGAQPKFHFVPVGLFSEDGPQRFYAPKDPSHVSHSIVNLQGTADFFEARCVRPRTLLRELGQAHVDLLKLDVEGAEYAVFDAMLRDGVRPTVVCVEYDQPTTMAAIARQSRELFDAGYVLIAVDGWNFTYLRVG